VFWVGIAVASGAAVSYGVSTVLRYMGAQHVDQDQDGQAPGLASTARTFVTPQFLLGTLFLLLGFAGGAAAARFLPLFLAQTIVAANLVVTALLGAVLLGNRISRTGWAAIGLVIGSLAAMGFSAAKQGDGGHGTGFQALPVSECVDAFVELAGVDQGPQDVVGQVPEAQGDATQVFEPAVDRLDGPVR